MNEILLKMKKQNKKDSDFKKNLKLNIENYFLFLQGTDPTSAKMQRINDLVI